MGRGGGAWRDPEQPAWLGASGSCWACPRERGEQERWGGSAAGQVLVETHLGHLCLGACLLCKGKARDVFSQCSLKKCEFLMVALRKEKDKRQTAICTLFGSNSHTALLIVVPVNFKWETLQISSASLTSVEASKSVILDRSYHGTLMYCT